MTVSATHDASAIATTASTAVPPSARISEPTSAVAGCPAATPGFTGPRYVAVEPKRGRVSRSRSCPAVRPSSDRAGT